MDNDIKIEETEDKPKARKPRKSADQKSKESILAAAEEVIQQKSGNAEHKDGSVPAVMHDGGSANHECIHKQVSVLLENELTKISGDDVKVSFSMENEFARAKKNSFKFSWKVMWSRLLICVMVVVAITFILFAIVSHNNKKIPVNVKGFDSVQLTEILNDVDKIEAQIREQEEKKLAYEQKRSERIQKVEDAYSAEKQRIVNAYNQEKKAAEKKFAQEGKKIEQTKGLFKGMRKDRNEERNNEKLEAALAIAKKKHDDAMAVSRNKYRNNLAQAKNLYKVEIDNCVSTIKRLREDRYRFDSNKVKYQAEYEGKLKDKDILHRREMANQKKKYDEQFIEQRNEYESQIAALNKKLEETIAADSEREKVHVEETVNAYDPVLLKDARVKKIVRSSGNTEYKVGTEDRISYLPKDGASELFKKSLSVQKEYYSDIAYLADVYSQFPHKENRAIVTYAKAMRSLANKAGNEIYASSVNEVNRILEEKNKVEYEKKTAIEERNTMQNDFEKILEAMCQENAAGRGTNGVVTTVSEKIYNAYVSQASRGIFTADQNKGKVFPCSIYRGETKIAIARVESKGKGKYILSNIALSGSSAIGSGDRIVFEKPYLP